MKFHDDKLRLVHWTDAHIGEPYRFDVNAVRLVMERINAIKEPVLLVMTGDMLRGHPYGHKYRDEEEDADAGFEGALRLGGISKSRKPKTVAEQLDLFANILRKLKYEQAILTEGNHEQTIFKITGDFYNSDVFREFIAGDGKTLPRYAGYEITETLRWPDNTEAILWAAHGGRTIGGATGGQWWRKPILDAQASLKLAQLSVSPDGHYPLKDLYLTGHIHRQILYYPERVEDDVTTTHDLGLRSIYGKPIVASTGGCCFRSGVCPHGDYHQRSQYRPYDVGWTEMLFDGDHWQKEATAKRVRKVRIPVEITTHNVKKDGSVRKRSVEL